MESKQLSLESPSYYPSRPWSLTYLLLSWAKHTYRQREESCPDVGHLAGQMLLSGLRIPESPLGRSGEGKRRKWIIVIISSDLECSFVLLMVYVKGNYFGCIPGTWKTSYQELGDSGCCFLLCLFLSRSQAGVAKSQPLLENTPMPCFSGLTVRVKL